MSSNGFEHRLPPYFMDPASVCTADQLTEAIDWGQIAYGMPEAWKISKGEGIKVCIADTGIEANHPDLQGQVIAQRDFSGFGIGDRQGHGTHVGGTVGAKEDGKGVIGGAPRCQLIDAKVLGDNGSGSGRGIADGVAWAIDQGADIISMSLGSPQQDPLISQAIFRAVGQGIIVIVAAGNNGRPNSVDYPGKLPYTTTVASIKRGGGISDFSSRGKEVDIAAPGEQIRSTWIGGRYSTISGTSMATPFVSAGVALMLSNMRASGVTPPRNRDELLPILKANSTDAGAPGHDHQFGWGIVDVSELVGKEPDDDEPINEDFKEWQMGAGGVVRFPERAASDGRLGFFLYYE